MIWHLYRLRVRYQETDQMGVVFYGNYMTWFEIGRTELVRQHGMTYQQIEAGGLLLPVVDLHCKYVAAARYDDEVIVCTAIEQITPLKVKFSSQVRRVEPSTHYPNQMNDGELPGQLLVQGGTEHVWVTNDFRPARLNRMLPELYEKLLSVSPRI